MIDTIELGRGLRKEMDSQKTVSDKIRVLDRAGVKRAEIARQLGKRYQHVRNVLEADAQKLKKFAVDASRADSSETALRLTVSRNGTLQIPKEMLSAMKISDGGALAARLENGELRLISPVAALKNAQSLVQKLVPCDISLADELIVERRQEGRN